MSLTKDELNQRYDPMNRAELIAECERLEQALKAQARAALSGMDAAKAVSSRQLQIATRLKAESAPEALESERSANARLTDENERLRAELAIVTKDRDTLLEMSGHTLEQVARRIEKLRGGASEPEGDHE